MDNEEYASDADTNQFIYDVTDLLLRALEFNANCLVAAYNTSDSDRKACFEYVGNTYDLLRTELDSLAVELSEDEEEEEEAEEEAEEEED